MSDPPDKVELTIELKQNRVPPKEPTRHLEGGPKAMCLVGQPAQAPTTAADAVAMAQAGLGWLAAADAASLTTAEQADCLRALERAASVHTVARARVLAAFHAPRGCADDG